MESSLPTRFWNSRYIMMCIMNLLMTATVFMQFPLYVSYSNPLVTLFSVSMFVLGMFLPGPFNAYLVDRYRRKGVCELSLMAFIAASFNILFASNLVTLTVVRLVQGASFGLFQMSLGGTLINDLSISKRRTATDYFFTWFGLFGIPVGVILSTCFRGSSYEPYIPYVFIGMPVLVLMMLLSVRVPFRAPNKVPVLSLDRFFQPRAAVLILNLIPTAIIPGMFVTGTYPYILLTMMCAGLVVGFMVHRIFFVEADYRADSVAGYLLVICAMFMLLNPGETRILYVAFIFLGVGIGWVESRILLYFLKMSEHCQRGTLQQTFVLMLYVGIALGFYLGTLPLNHYILVIILAVASLILFLLVTQPWFRRIKGREFKFKEV